MKRRLFVSALALALVAVLSAGATLAYFSAKSEVKTNTFTFGDVKIALAETDWDGHDYDGNPLNGGADSDDDSTKGTVLGKELAKSIMSGVKIPKNPTVKNTSTTNSAWIFMLVTFNKTTALGDAAEKKDGGSVWGTKDSIIDINSETAWKVIGETTDDNTTKILLGYNTVVPAGDDTSPAFTRIYFYEEMESEDFENLEGFQIEIAAYAVQANNIADLDTATTAIKSAYNELDF
jgi:predicted ribosomally synthesized peptide with SipW-like signal peptide